MMPHASFEGRGMNMNTILSLTDSEVQKYLIFKYQHSNPWYEHTFFNDFSIITDLGNNCHYSDPRNTDEYFLKASVKLLGHCTSTFPTVMVVFPSKATAKFQHQVLIFATPLSKNGKTLLCISLITKAVQHLFESLFFLHFHKIQD